MLAVTPRAFGVAAPLAERGEAAEHGVEKEAEPDTLALPLSAHSIHAIVPVARADQRQAVRADDERSVDRAQAMLVDVATLPRRRRLQIGFVLARLEQTGAEKFGLLVEHAPVARGADVERGDIRQPQQVIGAARARAAIGGWMPPVKHVTLDELMSGMQHDLCAGEIGPRGDERGRVLQLVAKSERSARLVEGRSAPDAACQALVEQPAVEHSVDGRRRRLYLDRGEGLLPERTHLCERRVDGTGAAVALDQAVRLAGVGDLAEQNGALDVGAGGDVDAELQSGARVEPGPGATVEHARVCDGGGGNCAAIAAEEGRAITAQIDRARARRLDQGGERNQLAELTAARVMREDRLALAVELGDDGRRGLRGQHAEHQVCVRENRQVSRAAAGVAQREPRDLHRVMARDECQNLVLEPVGDVPPAAVADAMARLARLRVLRRSGKRQPEAASRFVPDVQRLAVRIDHRIVRPRRQAVLAAVRAPGVARPALAREESAPLVGDDVDPRHGRRAGDDVLRPVVAEAAVAVVQLQALRSRCRGAICGPVGSPRARRSAAGGRQIRPLLLRELQAERLPVRTRLLGSSERASAIENRAGELLQRLGRSVVEPEAAAQRLLALLGSCEYALHFATDVATQVDGIFTAVRDREHHVEDRARSRLEPHAAAQSEHRVEDVADRCAERRSRRHRQRPCQRSVAADEAQAVRLVLELSFAPQPVREPASPLGRAARPAAGEQDFILDGELGLNEELGERRVAVVRLERLQHDLGVAGDLDRPGPARAVAHEQSPHLDIASRIDADAKTRLDLVVDPVDRHYAQGGIDRVRGGFHAGRLMTGGPDGSVLEISKVDEKPEPVLGAVGVPVGERRAPALRKPGPRAGQQHRVRPVGEHPRMRDRIAQRLQSRQLPPTPHDLTPSASLP